MPSLKYRSDIQGLRAIAVVSVVLFHTRLDMLPGGFVGVDIFFVISGFLITQLIVGECGQGSFTLRSFYIRRVRRIFPAFYVMLLATLAAGFFLLSPAEYRELSHTAISAIFFVSNYDFASLSGYFNGSSDLQPLLHTWSLAVEEQFYIVFPILILAVLRFARPHLRSLLCLAAAASLALSIYLTTSDSNFAFYAAPPRAFELLIGAIVAIPGLPPATSQRLRDLLSIAGLLAMAASVALFTVRTPFPGSAAVLPCAGAALVIHAGKSGSSVGASLISGRMFRFFGDISYSLYLWHWPLLAFARHYYLAATPWPAVVGLVLLSVALAYLSFRFVEQPFMKKGGWRWAVLPLGAGAMVAGSALAGAILLTNGLPERFSPLSLEMFAGAQDYNHQRERCHNDGSSVRAYADNCRLGDSAAAPDTVVWGDSHGAELAAALGESAQREGRSVLQVTSNACPPSLDYSRPERPLCAAQNQATYDGILADGRIKRVVLAADLQEYPPEGWAALSAGYRRLVAGLANAGKRVVLVDQIPVMNYAPPTALGLRAARGEAPETYGLARTRYDAESHEARSFVGEVAAQAGVDEVHVEDRLCDATLCHAYSPALGVLYFDTRHLSLAGARWIASLVRQDDESSASAHPALALRPGL
jgi:peptidoglycan/LPS O-acetylase OafA/YrhL